MHYYLRPPCHSSQSPTSPIAFTYRRTKSIDYSKIISDLSASPLIKNYPNAVIDLLDLYVSTLRSLLYYYAPLLTKTNRSSRFSLSPWITPDILNLKSACHRLERIYINNHSISDWKILRTNRYHKTILAAKRLFYSSLIRSFFSNTRTLSNTINNILYITADRSLPSSSLLSALPQMLAKFLAHKISKLHINLQSNPTSTSATFCPTFSPSPLHHFTPDTLSKISGLLSQSPNLHCNPDLIPITVLKKIANEIAPTVLSFANLSLLTGT